MLKRFAAALLSVALLAPAAAADFAAPPSAGKPVYTIDDPKPVQAVTRAQVRAALAARRKRNLDAFHAYRTKGVYPHNYTRTGPLNVWQDRDGHLCAAATIINADGQQELVSEVAQLEPNVRLLDVTDGPLMDWILQSGFTLEEIDRIQLPAPRPEPRIVQEPRDWRIAVDAKLRMEYDATEAWLRRHQKGGLDVATDRLMEHPELAAQLVATAPDIKTLPGVLK
jgi:hypothetical protein